MRILRATIQNKATKSKSQRIESQSQERLKYSMPQPSSHPGQYCNLQEPRSTPAYPQITSNSNMQRQMHQGSQLSQRPLSQVPADEYKYIPYRPGSYVPPWPTAPATPQPSGYAASKGATTPAIAQHPPPVVSSKAPLQYRNSWQSTIASKPSHYPRQEVVNPAIAQHPPSAVTSKANLQHRNSWHPTIGPAGAFYPHPTVSRPSTSKALQSTLR